jgi:hypothetical protein
VSILGRIEARAELFESDAPLIRASILESRGDMATLRGETDVAESNYRAGLAILDAAEFQAPRKQAWLLRQIAVGRLSANPEPQAIEQLREAYTGLIDAFGPEHLKTVETGQLLKPSN